MSRILRSYTKIWGYEKKIYSINDYHLPAPINLKELGYFVLSACSVYLIAKIIPFLGIIPPVILYLVTPYMLTQFLMKKKLDGKRPIPYFRDWVIFQIKRGYPLERFKRVILPRKKNIRISGSATRRILIR